MTYSTGGQPPISAVAVAPPIVVARVISHTVTWQDSAPVPTTSPASNRLLSFVVSNTGNGTETFRLARDNAVAGDQFDPASSGSAIWLESGAEPGFQASGPNADIAYVPGANDPAVPADATRWVYLLSNIPAGQATGALGRVALIATATTAGAAGAAPGTLLAGGSGGAQVLVGAGGAQASAVGNYMVAGVTLGLAKSVAAVLDPAGGTRVMTGSVLTYRLVVSVAGSGVATGVVIKDPLPASLTYVPGSLAVDGASRTDAADGDDASFAAGTVQADFGNVPAPATRVIEFKATVN